MVKVQIKSAKLTPFGGIFSIMEQFDSKLSPIIDQALGQRCRSIKYPPPHTLVFDGEILLCRIYNGVG